MEKLWSFFVTAPPSRATVRALVSTYRGAGLKVRPVVRQILEHPALYANLDAPDMIKAPIVYVAGSMRATGTYVTDGTPVWMMEGMGQELFAPPSVAGWEWGPAWISSNAMHVRFDWANHLIRNGGMKVPDDSGKPGLSVEEAFEAAHAAAGRPWSRTRRGRCCSTSARPPSGGCPKATSAGRSASASSARRGSSARCAT